MKSPSLRTVSLLLLLLLALLHSSRALEPAQDALSAGSLQWGTGDGKQDAYHSGYGHPDQSNQADQDEQGDQGDRGNKAVQEATAILRRIKPAKSRLSRFSKPSGVVGTTVYYAKELLSLLFMNAPEHADLLSTTAQPEKLTPTLNKAVAVLEKAALESENTDAIWLLAEMNFYGNFTHPRDYTVAFQRYDQLATLNGSASAQHMLAFMYATGIGGAVRQDQAKAMLHHVFAADAGDTRSQMTLAYRYHTGVGTARNCDEAVHYYKQVADKAVDYYKSGPPGGHVLVKNAYRLADQDGGVFGEGASVSSAGANAKQGGPTSDAYADLDDVLEYLDFESRKGDLRATFNLGRLYYDGSRGLARDMKKAKLHFLQVARLYWTEKGKVKADVGSTVEKYAPKAAGYLGRMFLRGEGMEQSYAKAKIWFTRAIASGDPLSQYSMGLMYLYGLGVPKDAVKAADYFTPAADHDLAVAQTNLGVLFLDQGDLQTAARYFELAARNSHIEAFYYLAEIADQGLVRDRSCGTAAAYYKIAAEKAEVIHSSFIEANEAYENGDTQTALIAYMMAAEQGSENAQANVAYLLDRSSPRYSLPSLLPFLRRRAEAVSDFTLALIYWTRSAKQSNIDSLVKMGDYHLQGLGTALSLENAAACYQAAAETMQSAQAMWNLGWMHENGVGIEQDFHLAKRFYDQALETNTEAYLPVKLSLAKLRMRSWWNGVSGGKINSIREEPCKSSLPRLTSKTLTCSTTAPKKKRTLSEWFNDFLEADAAYYADQYEADDWDAAHEPQTEHLPGDADNFFDDDIDDGILESLLIVSLAAALAALVYYRQQRQIEARRRQEQQGVANEDAPAPQQDGGLFPPPGDPEFANWVAGGVGH